MSMAVARKWRLLNALLTALFPANKSMQSYFRSGIP